MIENRVIGGKVCHLFEKGDFGPVILWGMFPHKGNEVAHLIECLEDIMCDQSYTVVAYQVEDWNGEFSPWEAPAVYGDDGFSGKGSDTLKWLTKVLLPELKLRFGEDRSYVTMGYSLAGLFALWCVYETDLLAGAISCSGSLWFPGWDDYAAVHSVKGCVKIYLSVGGKEEKTDHPVVATVGIRHRDQEKRLKADPHVAQVQFDLNSGGHFADSGKRLAKGLKWMLSK